MVAARRESARAPRNLNVVKSAIPVPETGIDDDSQVDNALFEVIAVYNLAVADHAMH